MPASARRQGSKISTWQSGPSGRPRRGVSSREVHGVRMRPMKTRPASRAAGGSTATSPALISLRRTMPASPQSTAIMTSEALMTA